jgi:hypothetical protein
MSPRATVGVGQTGRDPRRELGEVRHLPQWPPGMRHDIPTVRGHFHPRQRCDTLHLKVPCHSEVWTEERSDSSLQDRHVAYSRPVPTWAKLVHTGVADLGECVHGGRRVGARPDAAATSREASKLGASRTARNSTAHMSNSCWFLRNHTVAEWKHFATP